VYNQIAPKSEGMAPEASNEATDDSESVTKLFASALMRLISQVYTQNRKENSWYIPGMYQT
jgi:hypothetical protein